MKTQSIEDYASTIAMITKRFTCNKNSRNGYYFVGGVVS